MENKIDNLLKELVELKSTVATKEDIVQVKERIGAVEKSQLDQLRTQLDIQKRLEKLEAGEREATQPNPRRPRPLGKVDEGKSSEDYYKARRSLMISPVESSEEGIKEFLKKQMGVPRAIPLT